MAIALDDDRIVIAKRENMYAHLTRQQRAISICKRLMWHESSAQEEQGKSS